MLARRIRIASLAVLSLLAAAPAAADDEDDATERVSLALDALRLDEPELVVALMDTTVAFDLDGAPCGKALRKPGKAAGKTRLALAQCLTQLARAGARTGTTGTRDRRVRVHTTFGFDVVSFDVARVKGRARIVAIARVDARSVEGGYDPEDGVEGGVEGGVVGGVVGGVPYGPPPAPPPPPPAPPMSVAPQAFEALRVAGDKLIMPDEDTKKAIAASGRTQFLVPVKLCVDVDGVVTDVRILKSSGYPAYDQKLNREIRTWRYRPFIVNGAAAPACGMVNFSYRQT